MSEYFKTGYGEPIDIGQRFILNGKIYKIEKLEIIKFAGLIGSYVGEDGKTYKTNLSTVTYDTEKRLWKPREVK